ncbi:MAG TPA: hypothetical protein PLY47_11330 [Rhodoglobus sp.]|nr:hypothetical protein [Rhodoglobus sp.]
MTIADAAATDDRRATLVAMRDKLARDMDEAPPAVVAQISSRLSAVLVELEELAAPEKVSALDELDRRRQSRGAASGADAPAIKPKRKRRA